MPLKLRKVTKRKTFHSITLGHICGDYSKRGDRTESEFNTVMFDFFPPVKQAHILNSKMVQQNTPHNQ